MEHDRARQLIARIGVFRQPSDLDLLIFFARHPRTLIASERLATLTGYGPQQTADSLEVLLNAGLIVRSQKRSRPPQLYLFSPAAGAEWIHELFKLATTRPGRVALRRALTARAEAPALPPRARAENASDTPRPRPYLLTKSATLGGRPGEQREDA